MNTMRAVLEEAEIAVIGAGPAGTAAAARLAQLGHEVILVDQREFPREKACGDGLWGGAVRSLLALGLDDLVESALPIEGTRVLRAGSSRPVVQRVTPTAERPLARCIPRLQLDAALFEHALASGARFVAGSAEATIEEDGRVTAVVVRGPDGLSAEVRARQFVAADGADSTMRRQAGVASPSVEMTAYAVRQYFRTDNAIDPLFDFQLSLPFEQSCLPGYAWVFPVTEVTANIGVALYRGSTAKTPQGFAVLNAFVDGLRSGSASKFGDLTSCSDPLGAPLAINFSAKAAQKGNIHFVGDAARLTDPLIGEGISAALRSGTEAAESVDRLLRLGTRSRYGESMAIEFPRLGQNLGLIVHTYDRLVESAGPGQSDGLGAKTRGHPLLENVVNVVARGSDDDLSLEATAAARLVARSSAGLRAAIVSLNHLAVEAIRTEFPFAVELMHRQLQAGAGPTAVATVLLVEHACGGESNEQTSAGALAIELQELATHFMGQNSDETGAEGVSLGNGLAMLIADHALSQSLHAGTTLGPLETARFARSASATYEGAMTDVEDSWKLSRSPDRYLTAAGDRAGNVHAHAAALGARLAGKNDSAELSVFGRNLGIALKISDDVVQLVRGDYPTGAAPGEGLRHGNYTLPVIYALEEDPGLGELLGADAIEDSREAAVARIVETGAIERSAKLCERYANAACEALQSLELHDAPALEALAQLASDRANLD